MPENPLLAAALDAAARGWPVFPMRPDTKRPALHGVARCPRTGPCADGHAGWEQRATTDPDRITRAWTHKPYNIGIATGPANLLVVDLDTPEPGETPPPPWDLPGVDGGMGVLAVLADRAGEPVPLDTTMVDTPSGGLHLYFTAPDGEPYRNTVGDKGKGLGWHVDTRAWGGYVVAPGSTVDGRTYTADHTRPVAPLPAWLAEALRPAPLPPPPAAPVSLSHGGGKRGRYLAGAVAAEVRQVESAAKGDRNSALYRAAVALGQLVAGGELTEYEVRAALLSAAAGHIAVHAYTRHAAGETITSGLRTGARRPRTVTA